MTILLSDTAKENVSKDNNGKKKMVLKAAYGQGMGRFNDQIHCFLWVSSLSKQVQGCLLIIKSINLPVPSTNELKHNQVQKVQQWAL